MRVAGGAAVAGGIAGLIGLFSTLPWPELYSPGASPTTALFRQPWLGPVLVGHYVVLAVGGASAVVAGAAFAVALRERPVACGAAVLLALGSVGMAYPAAARAIDVAMNEGRSTQEFVSIVFAGGGLFLAGSLVLTLALRHRTSRWFLVLGIAAPTLVTGGLLAFVWLGEDAFPVIWGVTIPPPTDYVLAIWFIVLGWLAWTGQLGE